MNVLPHSLRQTKERAVEVAFALPCNIQRQVHSEKL